MSTPEDEQNNVDEPQIDEAGLDGSEDAVSEETSEPEQIQEH